MTTQAKWVAIAAICAIAGFAYAQQYPMLDMVANKVIQKYQSSTCEQLWQNRGKPPSEQEQRVLGFLKSDPQMRQEFFNRIAGPVMNKMFDCGMIP
jgi:hypothetical protein